MSKDRMSQMERGGASVIVSKNRSMLSRLAAASRTMALLGVVLVSSTVGSTQAALAQSSQGQSPEVMASSGTRLLVGQGGFQIKMLIEASNLGSGEVEIAEITFPGKSRGQSHLHGSTELIYVLSGRMDHKINGASNILEPGMVGIVRDGESVEHIVLSDEPVRAVVVWSPGGEAKRLEGFFEERPIE